MNRAFACCALLGAALLGCKGDKPQPAPSMPASAIGSVASDEERREGRPEPYANENLPDEADFADEAEKEITADNYGVKLGEIEKDIAAAEDAGAPAAATAAATATASATAKASAAGTGSAAVAPPTTGSAKVAVPGTANPADDAIVE
jgi:hypothetical protein